MEKCKKKDELIQDERDSQLKQLIRDVVIYSFLKEDLHPALIDMDRLIEDLLIGFKRWEGTI